MKFHHVGNTLLELPEAVTINGVRYYPTPSGKFPSITSVTSFKSREFFAGWRKKVGDIEADRITKAATGRGTVFHKYAEDYLNNVYVAPSILQEQISNSHIMFENARKTLDRINNIHALEAPLYSEYLGLAGRVDCIAEFDGELAIVDFKTSTKTKREEWIQSYFVQEVAYAYMYYERTGIEVEKLVTIIACEQDDEVQIFEIYDKMKYIELLKEYIDEFVSFHNGEKFTNAKR